MLFQKLHAQTATWIFSTLLKFCLIEHLFCGYYLDAFLNFHFSHFLFQIEASEINWTHFSSQTWPHGFIPGGFAEWERSVAHCCHLCIAGETTATQFILACVSHGQNRCTAKYLEIDLTYRLGSFLILFINFIFTQSPPACSMCYNLDGQQKKNGVTSGATNQTHKAQPQNIPWLWMTKLQICFTWHTRVYSWAKVHFQAAWHGDLNFQKKDWPTKGVIMTTNTTQLCFCSFRRCGNWDFTVYCLNMKHGTWTQLISPKRHKICSPAGNVLTCFQLTAAWMTLT